MFFSVVDSRGQLVNVARGKVVDSEALAQAVRDEQILGYATDVFEREPAGEDDPIVQLAKEGHPRIILTPHMGISIYTNLLAASANSRSLSGG